MEFKFSCYITFFFNYTVLIMSIKPIYLFVFALIPNWAFSQDLQDEETVIRAMLQRETEAFTRMSIADLVQEFWLLDDKTLLLVSLYDGTHLAYKKDDLLQNTEVPPEGHASFVKSEHKITIIGDLAYDTHEQAVELEDRSKLYSHEIRILRKVKGEWRIHVSSVHQYVLPE
jgi:hypothetical protein